MAVKTQALVEGTVMRTQTRSGTKDGNAWSMTNLLIIGDKCLADATVARGLEVPPDGTLVRGVLEIGVYRDDDSVTVVEWLNWDKAGKAAAS